MSKMLFRVLPSVAYPGTVLFGLGLFGLFLYNGVALEMATYGAITIATVLIILLEILLPQDTAWRPNTSDYRNETLYLTLVQILLPKFLALFVVFALYEPLHARLPILNQLWPHHWPLLVQFIVLLLLVDFIRYWVHRFAHTNSMLWRVHAVHHSTHKMFWLNTVRFHPVEKTLQLTFDSIPFILLGVDATVLAMYYVFYAINGFFQHCNIRLHLGWLNRIFSTADLHRWHHSKIPNESNTNYGNNLIVWDILFGTYYLPKDKQLGELGLLNRTYPLDFLTQLKTPFIQDLDKVPRSNVTWWEILHTLLIRMAMQVIRVHNWWPLRFRTSHPASAQSRVLRRIVKRSRRTVYGQKHAFDQINSYADFAQRVAVNDYENLRRYIEQQSQTGRRFIVNHRPVYFSVTSGTTDKPKFIPLGRNDIKRLRKEQAIFSYNIFRTCPSAFFGKMLTITSPAIEGVTEQGVPFGSASGLVSRLTPKLLKRKQVVPDEVYDINDHTTRYLVMACFAMLEEDITYVGTANPGSLLRLNKLVNERNELIKDILASGALPDSAEISATLRRQFSRRAALSVSRRQVLADVLRSPVTVALLWPRIRLVNTWTGGSCGVALQALTPLLPADCRITELGLIASELRVTFPVNGHSGALPNLRHAFFEFVEKDCWERDEPIFQLLHELKQDRRYYVFATTANGLYRYALNDIVEVNGYYRRTPLLSFVQKGQGVTNITGEKLYEYQAIDAVQSACKRQDALPAFFVLLADVQAAKYQLILERVGQSFDRLKELGDEIDRIICKINIEYFAKRQSDRLNALEVIEAKAGFGERLKSFLVLKGQREGQYKPRLLWYKNEFPSQLLTDVV